MIEFVVHNSIYIYIEEYLASLLHVLPTSRVRIYDSPTDVFIQNNVTYLFIQTVPPTIHGTNVYLLNIEQLTRENYRNIIYNEIYTNNRASCDYSIGNLMCVSNLKNNYLPYQYNPHEDYNLEKDRDVVFVGWCSGNRRLNILNKIPNILTLSTLWGKDRDMILFRHKILVNIHFDETYNVHEQIRTTRCVFNKMIVISERSIDDNTHPLRNHMLLVDYDDIPATVEKVIAEYDYYYNSLFNNPSFENVKEDLKTHLFDFKATII